MSFGGGGLNNANVLAAALDAGMNYIDTAEHYANGNSERAVGDALKGRDRKSVFLTTKLNLTFFKGVDKEGIRNRFGKCLDRLKTDYADCLMIHMCTLAQVKYEPCHELIKELKAEGTLRQSQPRDPGGPAEAIQDHRGEGRRRMRRLRRPLREGLPPRPPGRRADGPGPRDADARLRACVRA